MAFTNILLIILIIEIGVIASCIEKDLSKNAKTTIEEIKSSIGSNIHYIISEIKKKK